MITDRFREIINGAIIGGAQVVVGHPFDTLKTLAQSNKPAEYMMIRKWDLYRGVKYPALMSCGFNAGCFGLYTWGVDIAGWSPVVSGAMAGSVMGAVATPFEYYKVQKQTDGCQRQCIRYWQPIEWRRWQPSLLITVCREGISTALYFGIYEWMHLNKPLSKWGLQGDFIHGGLAGCSSWLFTYPLDTIKTRRQSLTPYECRNTKWTDLINIGNVNGVRGLYQGLGICLTRAFLVNGVTFWLYEKLHHRPDV